MEKGRILFWLDSGHAASFFSSPIFLVQGDFMIWDFAWLADPTAWLALGTLILLELVLGIDNLVFITFVMQSCLLPSGRGRSASDFSWRCCNVSYCWRPWPGWSG